MLLPVNGYAGNSEPVQRGAFLGQLPINIDRSKSNGFPQNFVSWAGNAYLFDKKIKVNTWVSQEKDSMIFLGLKRAKEYAKSEGYKYFAIDNITFQVVHTDSKVELFFDCNVIAWNK